MDVFGGITAQRLAVADLVEPLTPQQWQTQSLCDAWTVREVVAHLVPPAGNPMPRFLVQLIKSGGSFDRANIAWTAKLAQQPTAELVAALRQRADRRFVPPGMTPGAPMTDVLVHTQDIAIPLGIAYHADPELWRVSLEFQTSPAGRRGFLGKPLPAVQWIADDVSWRHGSGPVVEGTAQSIALVMSGRRPGLDGLRGEGVPVVSGWL